jgi:REP element-mobilizing transposase RayT
MGYPRHAYVQPGRPGLYHCVSRCVRRAYLCGEDALTGRSFAHRKRWVEERILELGNLFAVAVHAYAVMSNHVHVVIELNPDAAQGWSNREVARRWLSLFGAASGTVETTLESRIEWLASQGERIETLRQRLGSLSWFMRCLNEPLARRANREDGCSGRFWEGRFKCQALLDERSVLACMVYVDLNPVRAGVAVRPEASRHTSLRRRSERGALTGELTPVAASIPGERLPLTAADYLALVDWTGRMLHSGHKGVSAAPAPAILTRLGVRPAQWVCQVPATESGYWRVIGCAESITEQAQRLGRRWLCGLGFARRLEVAAGTT